jgi:non-specific serine/threonine protein kinase
LITHSIGRNHLPVPATPLVGRATVLEAIRARLLRDDVRLLTLTGTGGTGKTRLALTLAASLQQAFVDGIWFVDLSTITDAALVMPAIAQALGIREGGQSTELEQVMEAVRDRQLLLVLDNFEQVVAAAVELAELLKVAPRSKVLVTSRAVLHLSGEHEFAVPSLDLPERVRPLDAAALARYEAVALFVQRAEAALPGFEVTSANAAAVADICARLDGLPLAIELAAARIKVLPPQGLLARLSSPLQLLTSGARDRPQRQQSLRRTIDWSYGLLDDAEKALFRQLSVFPGSWTLEAAEAVTAVASDVVEGLASLLDKSLVQSHETTGHEPRYRMLETIREYAFEQLEAAAEVPELKLRLARYVLTLAEAAASELRRPPSKLWLDRLQEEHDNMRSTLRWAIEGGNAELALRLASAVHRYMVARGHLNEGQRWLESALALDAQTDPMIRARALLFAGDAAWQRGEYRLAVARNNACLELYRGVGDDHGVARGLQNLGNVALYRQEYTQAEEILHESLALYRKVGDEFGTAAVLTTLGVLARNRGDLAGARALGEEALAINRSLGDARNVAQSMNNIARAARDQMAWTEAVDLCAQSLRLLSELGDQLGMSNVLANVGIMAQRLGDAGFAARMFGAAEVFREVSTGSAFFSVSPAEYAAYGVAVDATRASLGEAAFTSAWQAGRGLPAAEVVSVVLSWSPLEPRRSASAARAEPGTVNELTPREQEVAVLIARGLTNREIAEALVISEWTVESHVRHILTKLHFRSRALVAAWAIQQGLVTTDPRR